MNFFNKYKIKVAANFLVLVGLFVPVLVMAQTSIPASSGNPLTRGWYLCQCCVNDVPCSLMDFFVLLKTLINAMLFASLPIAVIMIIMGGFKILTAQDNAGQRDKGKEMVTWAVYGMLITFGAWLIVNTLLATFTNRGGLDAWTKVFGR